MPERIDGLAPWMADWWRCREALPPTLILRCGIPACLGPNCGGANCRSKVGEIKSDGDTTIALMYANFGERTVPFTPRVTEESLGFPPGTVLRDSRTGESLSEQQERRLKELDQETIRYVGDGVRIAKRYNARALAITLDIFTGHIVCPCHDIVVMPDPDAVVASIRRVLDSAPHASKRQYLIFREGPLK